MVLRCNFAINETLSCYDNLFSSFLAIYEAKMSVVQYEHTNRITSHISELKIHFYIVYIYIYSAILRHNL